MPWLAALANLLYPPACVVCQAPLTAHAAPALCPACLARAARCTRPVCGRCGLSLPGAFDAQALCAVCQRRQPAFAAARAPWQYTGAIRAGIKRFKYQQRRSFGRWLAAGMAAAAREAWAGEPMDLVVPVPMHWLKARLRGFQPAAALAGDVARALALPCDPAALRCRRWTSPQARLSRAARRRNVAGAYAAEARRVRAKRVLLVDDVLTSSATAQACAAALTQAGAARVLVLTAARTPRHRDRAA